MHDHPWCHGLRKDYAVHLVLKYQVTFTALLKPKLQNVAEPHKKEINAPPAFIFLFFLTDLILADQSTAPTVGTAPSSASEEQNRDGYEYWREGKLLQASPQHSPMKGKQSCGSVHKNRTDKKGQKWWLMVSFNIISDLFSPFTLLFHTSSLFTFCKDLELDLPNNIRGPRGVCCYPWTAPSSLKSELSWEGREPT